MQRPTTTVRAHGVEWLAVQEFGPTIGRLDLERSRHPDALSPEEFVKDNTVRTVMRMPDPDDPGGPGLYLKRYKFRDFPGCLKHLFVATKPAREWEVCRGLQRAGIRTCDVLAIAVRRERALPREGFLLSREIASATSLPQFVQDELPELEADHPEYRAEIIEEMAALTAVLVDGGFEHRDYHAGNLMICPGLPAGQRLHVVDLHSIRLRRPTRRGLLRMLGMLTMSTRLPGASGDDDAELLAAFLARWQGGPGLSEDALARWSERVATSRTRLRRRHMRSRTRRCLVRSTLFAVDRTDGFHVHRRRDFPMTAALEAIRLHDEAVAEGAEGAEVLHTGRRTEVTLCRCKAVPPFDVNRPAPPEQIGPGWVCVKSFRRPSLLDRWKDVWRARSRAKVAWIASRGFDVRAIPAARPLALLESRSKLYGSPDYLITEALDNDGSLGALAFRGLPTGSKRRQLGREVARLLNLLAREEVYHPDTKPTNVLVKNVGGESGLWLVDLDRARFEARLTPSRWVKCLTRLNAGLPAQVSLLDRMRCLRECGRGRWNERERLRIARRIYRSSLRQRPAWLGQRQPP